MNMQEIIDQGSRIDELLEECTRQMSARRKASDRIFHTLQASFTFVELQNTTSQLSFNVPDGDDFEATRLQLYTEIRAIATDVTTQGPSDRVFRPTGWFPDLVNLSGFGFPNCAVEAQVELSYKTKDGSSRNYQNAPWFASLTFSGAVNTVPIAASTYVAAEWGGPYNRTETPGGLVFNPFFPLVAGSALIAKITPTFSGPRTGSLPWLGHADGRLSEYRIRGCLEGYKRRVRK